MPDRSPHVPTGTGHGAQPTVVKLPAEIDVTNHQQVRDALTRTLDARPTVLIADATATTFCDCSGVSALIRAYLQAVAVGTRLRVAASPAVWRILTLTGTRDLLSSCLDAQATPGSQHLPAPSITASTSLATSLAAVPRPRQG